MPVYEEKQTLQHSTLWETGAAFARRAHRTLLQKQQARHGSIPKPSTRNPEPYTLYQGMRRGGLAGVWGFHDLPRGVEKSEPTFVKQNRKLVQRSGFRFFRRPSEHVELFGLFSAIQVLGPRFEKSRFPSGLFRTRPRNLKSRW